jgi:hypothetical protein
MASGGGRPRAQCRVAYEKNGGRESDAVTSGATTASGASKAPAVTSRSQTPTPSKNSSQPTSTTSIPHRPSAKQSCADSRSRPVPPPTAKALAGGRSRHSSNAQRELYLLGDFSRDQYDARKRILEAELASIEPPILADVSEAATASRTSPGSGRKRPTPRSATRSSVSSSKPSQSTIDGSSASHPETHSCLLPGRTGSWR